MSDLLTYPSILVGSPCNGKVNIGPDDEEAVGDLMGSGSAQRKYGEVLECKLLNLRPWIFSQKKVTETQPAPPI